MSEFRGCNKDGARVIINVRLVHLDQIYLLNIFKGSLNSRLYETKIVEKSYE